MVRHLEIVFEEYEDILLMPAPDAALFLNARAAAQGAYAPYSNFYVGAAVLLQDGSVITGNNQENAAYPAGLCAERVALFYAGSHFYTQKINTIAIAAFNSPTFEKTVPVSPCGDCRQVMAECERRYDQPIRVIMQQSEKGFVVIKSASSLLPFLFSGDFL